ncbi:MAG: hypothetical protein ACR2P5_00780 [Gammaproteobacteria bacterium]
MNWEWFLVALPVVFLLGWFAARMDIRHIRKAAGALPRAYLQGLSHLLRGEKSAALDCFLRAEPLDPESEELQFAIGELSRARGEHRRALKIHHSLCERETIGPENRLRARWALARDYFGMGFLDIAEKHAALLAVEEEYRECAGGMLLDIFQRARKYEDALGALARMPPDAALARRRTRAHLLCECAARASEKKEELLNEALAADGGCVRANLMLGEAAAEKENNAAAAEYFAAAERQNTAYIWLAVPGLCAAFESQNRADEGEKKLRAWLESYPSPALFAAVYRALAARGRADGLAFEGVRGGRGAAAAAAWAAEQSADGAKRDFWRALEDSFAAPGWRCETCGYQTGDFSWQCDNCLSWESFRYAPAAKS